MSRFYKRDSILKELLDNSSGDDCSDDDENIESDSDDSSSGSSSDSSYEDEEPSEPISTTTISSSKSNESTITTTVTTASLDNDDFEFVRPITIPRSQTVNMDDFHLHEIRAADSYKSIQSGSFDNQKFD